MNSNDERRGRASYRGSASVRRAGTHSSVNNSPNRERSRSDMRTPARNGNEPLQGAEKYRQSAERNERPPVSISRSSGADGSYRNTSSYDRAARTGAQDKRAPYSGTKAGYKETGKTNNITSNNTINKTSNNTSNRAGSGNRAGGRQFGKGANGTNGGNSGKLIALALGVLVLGGCIFAASKLIPAGKENEPQETVDPRAIMHDAVVDISLIKGMAAEPAESAEGDEAGDPTKLNIKGMTLDEVRAAINSQYQWGLKVVNGDAEVGNVVKPTVDANETTEAATMGDAENPDSIINPKSVPEEEDDEITVSDEIHVVDLVAMGVDELIDEISANEQSFRAEKASKEAESETAKKKRKKEDESEAQATEYRLELPEYASVIDDTVAKAELMWYKAPKGGGIGSYDKEQDKFIMEGAEDGFKVDTEELRDMLETAVTDGNYTESIHVPGEILKTDMEAVQAEYKTIASFSTKTTDNSVRNKNIKIACEMLNGTIVKPGEEFSFNDAVGERTAAKGYGAAAAYNNGEVVQEVGGGVCQLSTTLYNAVLKAGLKTTKRQSHTFKPTYVTPGWDATISWGGPDYRFANVPSREEYSNDKSYAIGIRAHYANNEVTVSIYGRPVLKDGYTYELESKKIKDIDIVRKLIEEGSGRTPTNGSMGSQWTTDVIIKKDGEVVKREYDHKTYYSGHIQYYLEELPSESASESSSDITSETPSDLTVTGPDGGPGVTGGATAPNTPIKPSSQGNPVVSHGDDGPVSEPHNPVETFSGNPMDGFIEIG